MASLSGDPSLIDPGFDNPPDNPMLLLQQWIIMAERLNVNEPKGIVLSTVDSTNRPSSRVVLLKGCDDKGISFGSAQKSAKGKDLDGNPWAAANVWWRETVQQVNIQGRVAILSEKESDEMFIARTRDAQAIAALSEQSAYMPSEADLRRKVAELVDSGEQIKRPQTWHAYHLSAEAIEFWHGSKDRFHKRLKYDLVNGKWQQQRLQP
jgi:pyridoxamine-phosphate oxidase